MLYHWTPKRYISLLYHKLISLLLSRCLRLSRPSCSVFSQSVSFFPDPPSSAWNHSPYLNQSLPRTLTDFPPCFILPENHSTWIKSLSAHQLPSSASETSDRKCSALGVHWALLLFSTVTVSNLHYFSEDPHAASPVPKQNTFPLQRKCKLCTMTTWKFLHFFPSNSNPPFSLLF